MKISKKQLGVAACASLCTLMGVWAPSSLANATYTRVAAVSELSDGDQLLYCNKSSGNWAYAENCETSNAYSWSLIKLGSFSNKRVSGACGDVYVTFVDETYNGCREFQYDLLYSGPTYEARVSQGATTGRVHASPASYGDNHLYWVVTGSGYTDWHLDDLGNHFRVQSGDRVWYQTNGHVDAAKLVNHSGDSTKWYVYRRTN